MENEPKMVDMIVGRGSHLVTDADWDKIRSLGFSSVLNLETGTWEWLNGHANDETREAIRRGFIPLRLCESNFLCPTDDEVFAFFKITEDHRYTPVYVHCLHGKDRTGYFIAAYQLCRMGKPWEEVLADLNSFGFHHFPYGWWIGNLKILHAKYMESLHSEK